MQRIIDAGLPPELGRYLKAFILEEAGDVTRGTERFIEMYASGVFKKFRSLGILRMDDINVLSDFQLTQKFLRALTLDDVEDVVRAWETAVNDAIRIGDGVIDDLPHIADDAPAAESIMQMSIARQRGGHLSDDMIALASDGAQANHEANIAWERAIRQSKD